MYSTVHLDGRFEEQRCLFCEKRKMCYIIWGKVTAKDYKILLESNWSRTGTTMRKTINHKTCCPTYAIWCDAEQFRISKSQKKVLRNFNNFLYGRGKFEETTTSPATTACWEDRPVDAPSPKTNPELTESHYGKAVRKRVGGEVKVSAAKRVKHACDTPATTRDVS
ncbi:Arginyl-tRNA--protein transferase 1 [Taenia solium]